jgi:hypothetical protein
VIRCALLPPNEHIILDYQVCVDNHLWLVVKQTLIFLAQLLAGLPAACVVAERSATWMRRSISASDTICRTAPTSLGHRPLAAHRARSTQFSASRAAKPARRVWPGQPGGEWSRPAGVGAARTNHASGWERSPGNAQSTDQG